MSLISQIVPLRVGNEEMSSLVHPYLAQASRTRTNLYEGRSKQNTHNLIGGTLHQMKYEPKSPHCHINET